MTSPVQVTSTSLAQHSPMQVMQPIDSPGDAPVATLKQEELRRTRPGIFTALFFSEAHFSLIFLTTVARHNAAVSASMGGVTSNTVNLTVYPPASNVTGLTASGSSNTQVALSWTAAANDVGYQIAYKAGGTAPSDCTTAGTGITIITAATINGANSYTVGSLTTGQPYSFRVCANNTVGTFASGTTVQGMPTMTVATIFETSTSYDGNLGGISGADAKCATRAAAAGLAGTYKAMISAGTTYARQRLAIQGSVVNTHGQTVATSRSTMWSPSWSNAINYTESNVSSGAGVWTGFDGGGTGKLNPNYMCDRFTSSSSSKSGQWGLGWISNFQATAYSTSACNSSISIVCMSQPSINAISSFTGTAGTGSAGDVSITINFPADTAGYGSLKVRRASSATNALLGDCGGTLISTITSFSNTTLTDSTGAAGSYSYEACLYDLNSNLVSSTPLLNVLAKGAVHSIFVTNGTWNGNLGGLSGADTLCATAASEGGRSGTWKALISDGTTAAKNHITMTGSIYNFDDVKVANDNNAFWAGTFTGTVAFSEYSNSIGFDYVYTGTSASGNNIANRHCNAWTDGTNSYNGEAGLSTNHTVGQGIDYTNLTCNTAKHIYCISQ